ncbi:MAG: hypothetical protein P1P85_00620 [Patescibacteria group bacterium]|nr:hypothetical protein [Patescibacteria group bacterium]
MAESNNENPNLKEIEMMEEELAKKRAALENGPLSSTIETKETEITRENIHEKMSKSALSPTQQTTNDKSDKKKTKKDLDDLKNLDTVGQVKKLSFLAFEKGISHSIKIARSLNDAYLLDELHDKLIGELHEELINKGRLKDI